MSTVIKAPPEARSARHIVPPPPVQKKEPLFEDLLSSAPQFIREPLFRAVDRLNDYIFKGTPPAPPVPKQEGSWSFSAIGDYGSGWNVQSDIASNVAASKPNLIVTLGDNVYHSGTEAEWQKKWDPPELFGNLRKNFPVYPSLGNHDVRADRLAKPYFRRFPELDNARYYSYDYKNVHFTVVNSTESVQPGTVQYKWIEQDLANTDKQWKVMYFHHPLFSSWESHAPLQKPMRAALGPLLAKHGVDLVLAGHDHSYERTKPLNEHGTLHVVTGGGGNTLYPFLQSQPAWSAYRDVAYGHVNVEVRNDALVGRYMLRDGTIKDTFVIPDRPTEDAALGAASITSSVGAPAPVLSEVPAVLTSS